MKLHRVCKYILVLVTYAVSLVWIATKVWGPPESTFGKMIHQGPEDYVQRTTSQDVKYSMNGEYITMSGHVLFEVKGYQVEVVNGKGEFTLESILLKNAECEYSVDVIREKIDLAARVVGMPVKSDKIGFRAIIPTNNLVAGDYEIGFLLQDETVLWTSNSLVVK